MKLIFIYGLPAVGKLTVAKELSTLTGFKLFHNHLAFNYARALFDFGTKDFIDLREELWMEGFKLAQDKGFEGLIFTFVFEKTVKPDFVSRIKSTLGKDDSLVVVHLKCSREEILKRVAGDERRNYGKITSPEKLAKSIDEGFVYLPKLDEQALEIDITSLPAIETAKKILEYMNSY